MRAERTRRGASAGRGSSMQNETGVVQPLGTIEETGRLALASARSCADRGNAFDRRSFTGFAHTSEGKRMARCWSRTRTLNPSGGRVGVIAAGPRNLRGPAFRRRLRPKLSEATPRLTELRTKLERAGAPRPGDRRGERLAKIGPRMPAYPSAEAGPVRTRRDRGFRRQRLLGRADEPSPA